MSAPTPTDSNPLAGGSQPVPATPTNPLAGGSTPDNAGQHPLAGEGQIDPGKYRETMRENQALRKRLDALDEAAKQAELDKLGNVERLQKQYEAEVVSRKAAQDRAAQTEAMLLARELGIVYPDVAVAAIKDKLKIAADGSLENAEDLLKAFIEAHPLITAQQAIAPSQAAPQVGLQPANPSRSSQQSSGVPTGFDPNNPPRWSQVPFGQKKS
jgi:hypothetical protein